MSDPARSGIEAMARDYRAAFQRYLPSRGEAALTTGYRLGRAAVVSGVSVLDVVEVHHVVLAEVLASSPADEVDGLVRAAGEFLAEVLSTLDLAHRALLDTAHDPPE